METNLLLYMTLFNSLLVILVLLKPLVSSKSKEDIIEEASVLDEVKYVNIPLVEYLKLKKGQAELNDIKLKLKEVSDDLHKD